jgi:hypothetical protein
MTQERPLPTAQMRQAIRSPGNSKGNSTGNSADLCHPISRMAEPLCRVRHSCLDSFLFSGGRRARPVFLFRAGNRYALRQSQPAMPRRFTRRGDELQRQAGRDVRLCQYRTQRPSTCRPFPASHLDVRRRPVGTPSRWFRLVAARQTPSARQQPMGNRRRYRNETVRAGDSPSPSAHPKLHRRGFGRLSKMLSPSLIEAAKLRARHVRNATPVASRQTPYFLTLVFPTSKCIVSHETYFTPIRLCR